MLKVRRARGKDDKKAREEKSDEPEERMTRKPGKKSQTSQRKG